MRRRLVGAGLIVALLFALVVGRRLLTRLGLPAISDSTRETQALSHPALTDSSGLTRFGLPQGLKSQGRLLHRSAFECFHDPRLKVSRWVAYRAEGEDTTELGRYSGGFFPDPDLSPGQRAELVDYQGLWKQDRTGYDRGHQAPDATLRVFGLEAQRETYSLANITAQHSQINQGAWADIEAELRRRSSRQSPVWVITGPVFFADRETLRVGPDRVAVPHAYYAIADQGPGPAVVAFLVVNQAEAPWYGSLDRFLTSVDSVERLTGLDFLSELPDSLENRLEAARPRRLLP